MITTFRLGDMVVHRLVEAVEPFLPAFEMLPDLTPKILEENSDWLGPSDLNEEGRFLITYQCYIVRTPHHVILVDSCLGNHKERPRPEWHMRTDDTFLRSLGEVGLRVTDIDFVLCTHLHGDHVGWNTQLVDGRWVPVFPNARYVFQQKEVEATAAIHADAGHQPYADSVLPIIEAGRADLVGDDFQIGDHVRLLPTPGHTAGHVAFAFGRGRDEMVMSGDLIHVTLQLRYPELSFSRDADPVLAAKTRRTFLERYCDTDVLLCAGHFPDPSIGRIRPWGGGFRITGGPGQL
ncbi:MBL fold metallo-hydrolase [Rhodococcus koreensis]|uniref:MBL fold metallo-hydrolase n=1 Tax=Rhodococcus koreensis TaxID=99653 RepID=UPI003671B68C